MSSLFRNRQRASICWAAIVMFILALGPALAPQCFARPNVGVEFDADVFVSDNPFLLPGEDTGAAAADVAARPYLDWDLDPHTRLEFTGEVGFRQFHRRYGNFVTGFADLQLQHRRNEYLTVGAQVTYDRSLVSDPLSDSLDFAFDSRGVHESAEVRPTVAWNPNARVSITGDMGWRKMRYPGSILLRPIDAYDVGVSASRRMNAATSLGAQARLTSSQSGDGGDTSVTSFNIVATHRLSEHWYGDVQAGVEWTGLNDPIAPDDDNRAQFNGGFSLCHEPRRTVVCVTGAIRSEVSGFGGLQREKTLGATLSSRVSERGTITGEFDGRKANLPGFTHPASILRASGGYEHRLDRNIYLTSNATYMQRKLLGQRVDAVILQVGLSIRGSRI